MPQFFIRAYDGTDAEAPARRKAARPIHLDELRPYMERGEIKAGGALLNDADQPIGSILIVEFEDRAALDAWITKDPYTTQGVWQKVEIERYRPAVFDCKLLG